MEKTDVTQSTLQSQQTLLTRVRRISVAGALVAGLLLLLALFSPPTSAQGVPAPGVQVLNATMPNPEGEISASRQRAYQLFRAITGVPVAIDDARLTQMEALIAAGNERDAAKIATTDPLFYDVQLRDIARRMSTRDETVRAPVSDFVATFVGSARDGIDARELLSGNYIYQADPAKTLVNGTQVVRSTEADLYASNNHYADIISNNLSLYSVLMKVDGQKIFADQNAATTVPNSDPAGLITSRAFIQAHAEAGTNRRLVEFTFREFMCVEMAQWSDARRPDDMVGRDVDRFPGGTNEKYQVPCKACHAQMDGLRQAFAYVDFLNNRAVLGANVVGKMNRNGNEFPEGYTSVGNRWVNYATVGKNADQFGWRSALTGTGMRALGQMVANSKGFSRCMAKRVFSAVCKHPAGTAEESMIRSIADEFEKSYRITDLAEMISINSVCMAKQ